MFPRRIAYRTACFPRSYIHSFLFPFPFFFYTSCELIRRFHTDSPPTLLCDLIHRYSQECVAKAFDCRCLNIGPGFFSCFIFSYYIPRSVDWTVFSGFPIPIPDCSQNCFSSQWTAIIFDNAYMNTRASYGTFVLSREMIGKLHSYWSRFSPRNNTQRFYLQLLSSLALQPVAIVCGCMECEMSSYSQIGVRSEKNAWHAGLVGVFFVCCLECDFFAFSSFILVTYFVFFFLFFFFLLRAVAPFPTEVSTWKSKGLI